MLVFLRDVSPDPLHGGWMARFNDAALPVAGDEVDLGREVSDDHPLDGLWVVVKRRFARVGEDRQHITLFIKRIEEES